MPVDNKAPSTTGSDQKTKASSRRKSQWRFANGIPTTLDTLELMRRSAKVVAPLLAASAVTFLPGCQKVEMRRCVDMQNMVVANELCSSSGEQRILGQQPRPAGTFRYYYGGECTHESGTTATGGSFLPLAGHSYEAGPKRATRRGGFGNAWPLLAIAGLVGVALVVRAGE
jgi:hypothetical protein